MLQHIDFSGLVAADIAAVECAIARGENFYGYIPNDALTFIVRNYERLKILGVLEAAWLDAYVQASHFAEHTFASIKSVFDVCDKARLRSLKPIDESLGQLTNGRVTIFRGCAGPVHTMGMSWIRSLDKAIWYAAHHASCYDLKNTSVYVATVSVDEIYCQLGHFDEDLIVNPKVVWKIDVPTTEFRLDRPR